MNVSRGIEVAHTFLLGEKYSKPLNAVYLSKEAKQTTLQMGSYGIGLSRLIAATIEILSLEQEMRWPDALLPFSVVIIPAKVVGDIVLWNKLKLIAISGGFEGRMQNEGSNRKIV